MENDLSPQSEQFIEQALALGRFASREALLDEAVESLRMRQADRESLIHDVNMGIAQLDAGDAAEWTAKDLESIRNEGRRRLGLNDECHA